MWVEQRHLYCSCLWNMVTFHAKVNMTQIRRDYFVDVMQRVEEDRHWERNVPRAEGSTGTNLGDKPLHSAHWLQSAIQD